MKIAIATDLDCAYRWSAKFNQLEWAPLEPNGTIDIEDWGCVDEEIVGEELVTLEDREQTLSTVYRTIEARLGV